MRRVPIVVAVVASMAASIATIGARLDAAGKSTARLSYVRGKGAESCPDEPSMRGSVAERLGYDPFEAKASKLVAVAIVRDGSGFHAQIEVRDEAGKVLGKRRLDSKGGDCGELAGAVSLDIAIAIDPIAATTAPLPLPPVEETDEGSADASTASTEAASVPEPKAPIETSNVTSTASSGADEATSGDASSRENVRELRVLASGGIAGTVGVVPGPGIAFIVGGALRWPRVSLGLEGRVDLPQEQAVSGTSGGSAFNGTFRAWILSVALVPCVHRSIALVCALGALGSMQATTSGVVGNQAHGATDGTKWAAAGGRLGVEVPFSDGLFGRFHVDVLARVSGPTIGYPGRNDTVWTSPLLGGSLVADLVGVF